MRAGELVRVELVHEPCTAAIDEYSQPWMPPISESRGPSLAPLASNAGCSSPASGSCGRRWCDARSSCSPLNLLPREVAGGDVVGARKARQERRVVGRAERLLRDRAARMEAAAGRQVDGARRVADDAHRLARRGPARAAAPPSAAPACRGGAGSRTAPAVGADSTIRPRYMTATRSATWRTTAMLWAISSTVSPSLSRRSSSRFRTVACTETSSAETGSSATSSSGSSASARAIADALALAAGELPRVRVERARPEPDQVEQLPAALVDARPSAPSRAPAAARPASAAPSSAG